MSLRASVAILRNELRILRREPETVLFVLVMPLAMAAFMKELFRTALVAEGFPGATGAEHAVPGMAVGFAAFSVGFSGFAFFREHGWGTWERLRATPASTIDILVGKVTPAIMVTFVQMGTLFVLGGPLLGFRLRGSVFALVLVAVVLAICLNAFGVAVTALVRTQQQLNAVGSAGGMVLGLVGGAFVPVTAMPGWAQAIAPVTPTYWAMRGFRSVVLEGAGPLAVLVPVAVMLAFVALFGLVAALRFRFEETKVAWG